MKNVSTLVKTITPLLGTGLVMPVIHNPYVIGSICFLIICLGVAVIAAVIAPNGFIK